MYIIKIAYFQNTCEMTIWIKCWWLYAT